jgi:penicillin-binding protein 1C
VKTAVSDRKRTQTGRAPHVRAVLRALRPGPVLRIGGLLGAALLTILCVATALCFQDPVPDFHAVAASIQTRRIVDRHMEPLSVSYTPRWNTDERVALHAVPDLLRETFLLSEDRRFFSHGGVDWRARGGALWQNLRHGRTVRGASTLTEQTIRILHPRPRTLWSKWVEGWEAMALDRAVSKAALLEFYLNQVPYAANRRGVAQAARYYFDRSLETLTPVETLALVVLARAPSGYDLYRDPRRIEKRIAALADRAADAGLLDEKTRVQIHAARLTPRPASAPVEARHFARYVRLQGVGSPSGAAIRTTLDAGLQTQVQTLLDRRMDALARRKARNGAALVVDRRSGEILAWVVAGATRHPEDAPPPPPGAEIDPVTAPRQPGSALKPFLYAAAIEKGWSAATMIDDSPLAEAIGAGLHRFRNYSGDHYGPLPLREALGNSLNIPALRTIRYVGTQAYLDTLHDLGFETLDRGAAIYDEGLALGDGEVTLLALVQAYTVLANGGVFRPLRFTTADDGGPVRRVYRPETADLIANILSDASARAMEFGTDSVLNLPVQTAAKTGTSTGYRDAWVAGFDDRYVVGIWMGNLDRTPMDEVTGSTGPALTLRGIFALLNRDGKTRALTLSPRLHPRQICTRPPKTDGSCPLRTEWFADAAPSDGAFLRPAPRPLELVRPTQGLNIARNPRIPEAFQKFRFELAGFETGDKALWTLDGRILEHTQGPTVLWPLEKGAHSLSVQVSRTDEAQPRILPPVRFVVK